MSLYPNPQGYRPPTTPARAVTSRRRQLEQAQQRANSTASNDTAQDYDPFGVLEEHGAHVDRNGNTVQGKPINAHPVDTDPQGGLHTTGLKTEGLATGGLQGGPTPVGTGPSVARVVTPQPAQTNVVVQGGGSGSGHGRSGNVVAVAPSTPAGNPSGGSAISDGSKYSGVPTHDADGKQDGWEFLTPDQANFGHLPGTASHPTQPAASSFPKPPTVPVRLASGAGVEGTGLPHDVAVELDQAQRHGTGTSFALPPGGFGKTWQGEPSAAPVAPVTHNADGTPVAPRPASVNVVPGDLRAADEPRVNAELARQAQEANPNPGFGDLKMAEAAESQRQANAQATQAQTQRWNQAVQTGGASDRPALAVTPVPKLVGQDPAADRQGRTELKGLQDTYASLPGELTKQAPTHLSPPTTEQLGAAAATPLPSEPGGSTASTTAPQFPKPPTTADTPFAAPKPLTLASTAPAPTVPVAPTVDPEELKRRLAGR